MKVIVVYQVAERNGLSTLYSTFDTPFEVSDFPVSEKDFYIIHQKLCKLNDSNEVVILNLIPLRAE